MLLGDVEDDRPRLEHRPRWRRWTNLSPRSAVDSRGRFDAWVPRVFMLILRVLPLVIAVKYPRGRSST